jgi:hypothetical protein
MPGYLWHRHALGQPQDFWVEVQVPLRPAITEVDLKQLPFTDQVADGHRLEPGGQVLAPAPGLVTVPLKLDQRRIPPAGRGNRTPTKGRWGGINRSSPMDLDGAEKTPIRKSEKFSLQDLYPPPGEERDSGLRTMGVGSMVMIAMAVRSRCRQPKISLQDLYPRCDEDRFIGRKDDGGCRSRHH